MSQDVSHYFSIVPRLILHTFRCGAISKIEITRKTRGSRKVRFRNPQAMNFDSQLVGLIEPLAIFAAGSLLSIVDPQNHGGEERWLGTCEILGPVGIQDGAVMLDLEQEVVHHVLSKIEPPVAEKTHADEVAVP